MGAKENFPSQEKGRMYLLDKILIALRDAALFVSGNTHWRVLRVTWNKLAFQLEINAEIATSIEQSLWCSCFSGDQNWALWVLNELQKMGFDFRYAEQFNISVEETDPQLRPP